MLITIIKIYKDLIRVHMVPSGRARNDYDRKAKIMAKYFYSAFYSLNFIRSQECNRYNEPPVGIGIEMFMHHEVQ